jgi:hypothetical protein
MAAVVVAGSRPSAVDSDASVCYPTLLQAASGSVRTDGTNKVGPVKFAVHPGAAPRGFAAQGSEEVQEEEVDEQEAGLATDVEVEATWEVEQEVLAGQGVVEAHAIELQAHTAEVEARSAVEEAHSAEVQAQLEQEDAHVSEVEAYWSAAKQALEERSRRERVQKVDAFLRTNGFTSVNARRGWFSGSYPLHVAIDRNDLDMVKLLLLSSAHKKLKDANGRTAIQRARERNHYGSHAAVLKALLSKRKKRPAGDSDMVGRSVAAQRTPTNAATCEASVQCSLEESDEI